MTQHNPSVNLSTWQSIPHTILWYLILIQLLSENITKIETPRYQISRTDLIRTLAQSGLLTAPKPAENQLYTTEFLQDFFQMDRASTHHESFSHLSIYSMTSWWTYIPHPYEHLPSLLAFCSQICRKSTSPSTQALLTLQSPLTLHHQSKHLLYPAKLFSISTWDPQHCQPGPVKNSVHCWVKNVKRPRLIHNPQLNGSNYHL